MPHRTSGPRFQHKFPKGDYTDVQLRKISCEKCRYSIYKYPCDRCGFDGQSNDVKAQDSVSE